MEEEKNETMDDKRCCKFVSNYNSNYDKILSWLEEVHLILSGAKYTFGVWEVVIIRHLCEWFHHKLDPSKVDAIQWMKDICSS